MGEKFEEKVWSIKLQSQIDLRKRKSQKWSEGNYSYLFQYRFQETAGAEETYI